MAFSQTRKGQSKARGPGCSEKNGESRFSPKSVRCWGGSGDFRRRQEGDCGTGLAAGSPEAPFQTLFARLAA